MLLLTLLLMLAVALGFLYHGRPYRAWVFPLALGFSVWGFRGGADSFWFWALLIPTALVATLFGVASIRRALISGFIMEKLGPILPTISDTEKAALEAGTVWWDGELFSGNPDWQKLLRFQTSKLSEKEQAFLDGPVEDLCRMLDDWQIMRQGDLPEEIWDFLKQERFLGMIIPEEYGGHGFSALGHSAVITKISSRSTTASVTVMVPNSLGPAELLMHYGTDSQKRYYLPRLASGEEIPAFALTEPNAGSDAAAGQSTGVICKGHYQGKEVLGMRLNWNKRYITLGPVCTVLGLAFRLQDPDHLLGDTEDLGITCALIPSNIPGVEIGLRHDPLGVPFQNGPNYGKDVFVPIDFIIGGREQAGTGWKMLMDSLAAGRSISLPSLSAGACQMATRVSGSYATIREQFNLPIGRFEGIQEPLARIAGLTYVTSAARKLTASAVDAGEKPAVVSAIAKAYMTEIMRQIVNDACDIQAGAAICQGPRNVLAHAYRAVPIGITVEGANILTRTLIIYGQGAIRCHPHVQDEIRAVEERDLPAFDKAFFGHTGFVFTNATRAFLLGLTGGKMLTPPLSGPMKGYFGSLTRYSAAFTFLSDVAMGTLGAQLKRTERLSGRMADALAWMYLASATLKRFVDEGQPPADRPFMDWACQHALYEIETALSGVLDNFPIPMVATAIRPVLFPLGRRQKKPSDQLGTKVARAILDGAEGRETLTKDIFVPGASDPGLGRLESALQAIVAARPAEKKLQQAAKEHRIPKGARGPMADAALEAGIISQDEYDQIWEAIRARDEAVQVDAFEPEVLCPPNVMEALEQLSS